MAMRILQEQQEKQKKGLFKRMFKSRGAWRVA